MEQHPVPQQISSYQFRLVGDMTLKQFFQVAGGVLIAILLYASGLPGIFKWPLIGISVITGAAMAFLPIEERPLEDWILAFFRSIYSPTLFYWSQTDPGTKFFQDQASEIEAQNPLPATVTQAAGQKPTNGQQKLGFLEKLEEGEKAIFSRFMSLYQPASTQAVVPAPVVTTTPQGVVGEAQPKQETVVPKTGTVTIEKSTQPVAPTGATIDAPQFDIGTAPVAQTLPGQASNATTAPQAAQFSQTAAPPIPPTNPNIIVGQVFDAQGNIVEGAILEVKDMQSRPVRALKSNKVGHFMIVTPLMNGTYELSAEKQGIEFDPVKFEAAGLIIPPIAIKAK